MRINFDKNLINKKFRFLLNREHDRPMTILKGGSSSSKTFSICQVVPSWILEGHNILIARESGNTLRRSIFSEVCKAIRRQKLQKLFTIRKTTLTIQSRVSNGCCMFVATSDEEKLKSITPIGDALAFDICIMEEASEISASAQTQLRLRMRGRTKFAMKRTYMLLNPIARTHHIYKKFYAVRKNPDNVGYIDDNIHLHHSTYKDNPYLDESEKEVLESMKEISPRHYEVYALGQWGTMTKTIYSHWRVEDFDLEDLAGMKISIGLDWGHEHPLGVSFVAHNEKYIYVFDELNLRGKGLEHLVEKLKQKIAYYGIEDAKIFCDWQEPRSIQFLVDNGLRAEKAWKDDGSVNFGIEYIQMRELIFHKKCVFHQAEASEYSWKEVDGEVTDTPIKRSDDNLDAMRYSMSPEMSGIAKAKWGNKKALFARLNHK